MSKPQRTIVDEDIHEAALWRLAEFPAELIEASTARVAQLVDADVPLESNHLEVAAAMAELKRPGDRRSGWSALMAVTALYADSQGYARLFLVAGFEVVKASQQGKRGSHHNRRMCARDSMDDHIKEFLAGDPAASTSEIFQHFADIACSSDPVFVEYDQGKDELVCQLDPDDEKLTNVSREEFAGRVRRATGCSFRVV